MADGSSEKLQEMKMRIFTLNTGTSFFRLTNFESTFVEHFISKKYYANEKRFARRECAQIPSLLPNLFFNLEGLYLKMM